MFTKSKFIALKFSKPDINIFENLQWSYETASHTELTKKLYGKDPYSITIILENLAPEFYNNSTYVKKTKIEISNKYLEILHIYFNKEFGTELANSQYSQWLNKYRPIWSEEGKIKDLDKYIIENELEPRYLHEIKKRYKDIGKLKLKRYLINKDRYYHLAELLNHVDWRSPYDNLFIWTENNQKYVARGGSGSSGARETNSRFIYTFGLLNQQHSIPSYLYIYSRKNQLFFIEKFPTFTIPKWDIGSNYHISREEDEKALQKVQFLKWEEISELKRVWII